jgi:hypothetical protein
MYSWLSVLHLAVRFYVAVFALELTHGGASIQLLSDVQPWLSYAASRCKGFIAVPSPLNLHMVMA